VRAAVLGAGVAGLVAAHRLAQAGDHVDVYERWPGLGGQAATFDLGDGHLLERYYHHLFTSDREMADLCRELGVALIDRPSSVGMLAGGRLYPFTTPLDLLRYRPLRLHDRVRMGFAVLMLQRRHHHVGPLEDLTAREWVERHMGRAAYAQVWGPLLRGKFGDRADEVGMSWLWAKLRTRRQIKGQEAREERLVYPAGTFEAIFTALREAIERHGGRVFIDRPAARVDRGVDGRLMVTPGARASFRRGHDPRRFEPASAPEPYDAVLATVPSDVFEQLLTPRLAGELDPGYLERARSIEYLAALCLVLELDRPFHRFYWTNVLDEDVPFIGLIEQTKLIAPERYGGRHLLYVANYLEAGDPLMTLDPDALLGAYLSGLRAVRPDFTPDWVKRRWRFAEPAAQPVVLTGHRRRMPPLATGARGLVLANTTQVYPEDRGTNYAVRLGGEAAAAVRGAWQTA
jgi:protoporphyrinogen oxidase